MVAGSVGDRGVSFLINRWVRLAFGPGLFVAADWLPLVPEIGTKVVAFLLVAGGALAEEGRRKTLQGELQRADVRRLVEAMLRNAVRAISSFGQRSASADLTLRSNVMLLDEKRLLYIAYRSNPTDDDGPVIKWKRGEGCAGHALESGRTIIAPEEHELPVRVEDAKRRSRPWNMTAAQVQWTADRIASVISTPIRRPGDDRIFGILNFDDEKPLEKSLLGMEDVRAFVEDLAEGLGKLFAMFSEAKKRPG